MLLFYDIKLREDMDKKNCEVLRSSFSENYNNRCINMLCLCRDRRGKIVQPAPFQSRLPSGSVARVEPNRRWFGKAPWNCVNAVVV